LLNAIIKIEEIIQYNILIFSNVNSSFKINIHNDLSKNESCNRINKDFNFNLLNQDILERKENQEKINLDINNSSHQ